jgi:septin 7
MSRGRADKVAGNLLLITSMLDLMPTWSKRTESTGSSLLITEFTLVSTSFSLLAIRELSRSVSERITAKTDRLKPIDIEFMRRLHQKVNLIPVIAKADTLTEEEVGLFKQRVSYIARHVVLVADN